MGKNSDPPFLPGFSYMLLIAAVFKKKLPRRHPLKNATVYNNSLLLFRSIGIDPPSDPKAAIYNIIESIVAKVCQFLLYYIEY